VTERIRPRERDPRISARLKGLSYAAAVLFVLLAGRLYFLQVVEYERYLGLAENNRLRIRPVRAPRGQILDRHGRALADTEPAFDLVCTPVDVRDLDGELRLLAKIVEMDAEEAREKILEARRANPFSSVTVARALRFEQVSVIEFNREHLPGFAIQVAARRNYPFGPSFAHVLGYVGEASADEIEESGGRLRRGDVIGKYGLERELDGILRGVDGGRRVEVDAAGRDKRLVDEIPPRAGGTVRTALDADLQKAAEEAMGERAGAVIAMDPRSGEILAFVSLPAFDPNAFARGIRRDEWKALSSDPRKPMQNRGLQGSFPPGSTVKPLVALAALEAAARDPDHRIVCRGVFPLGNRVFRCWKPKGHGAVDMYRAIVQSCDVYFYGLALSLGPEVVAKLERDAGLGTLTGIDLPGERRGLVPDPAWKRRALNEKWYDSESAMMGIGQGPIHVTPLELLVAYAALATGGEVVRPRVVLKTTAPDGTESARRAEVVRKLGWKPQNVAFVRRALWGVVNDYGTAQVARLPDVAVGGKTGTAQVAAMKGKVVKSEDLPYHLRDHAWFVGLAPAQAPEICVVALVEHGGHGASAAAPVVRAVLQEYFRTRPVPSAPGAR